MAHNSLQQRQLEYEDSYSYKIIPRIPIIIKINGRSFSKVTKQIQKPFCHKTMTLLSDTMLSLAKQIDGVVFGYQYSDKIILVIRNDRSSDEDPWFGNCIQKQASASSSIATYEFMSKLWAMDDPPALEGSITFTSSVFGVPSIKEAINNLLYRQFRCLQNVINESVQSILWPRYGPQTNTMLNEKSMDERKKILDEAGFEFDSLPSSYRHGSGVYLTPALVTTSQGQITRQKWIIDFNLPLFTDSKEWLNTIITTGSDIFRPERDYNDSSTRSH